MASPIYRLIPHAVCLFFVVLPTAYGGDAMKDGEKRDKELEPLARKVYTLVRSNQPEELLKLVDPKIGVSGGGDAHVNYQDLEKDFRKKGPIFCDVFGCAGKHGVSVRDIFNRVDPNQLEIEIHTYSAAGSDPVFMSVIPRWPGMKDENRGGALNLEFRWTRKDGWHLESMFID